LAAHFAKRNTKFGGGGKRGRAKIPSPQPPSFLPARAFSLARGARHQFRSKKVRISSNKRTSIKLSGILPTDSATRSAPSVDFSPMSPYFLSVSFLVRLNSDGQ